MSAIDVVGLHKRYRDTVAVDDVTLSVGRGEIVGLLGRNGAGKSTTVACLAGLRRPDRGTVRVLGLDPRRDRTRIRQVLGVQLQESYLHHALTVRELVRLYRSFYRDGIEPDQIIEAVGLSEQRGTRFEQLSGGQQQRLSIALALVGKPRVALLDELTTGLDPEARRHLWEHVATLRADGVAVLLVSHHMDEVRRLCDRVVLLDRGRVVAEDTPEGLIRQAGLGQRVRFRITDPARTAALDAVLTPLTDVDDIEVAGTQVTVTGRGELLEGVSTALAAAGIAATETRLEQATLDDAFLALTGRPLDDSHTGSEPRS
ncbi:multidrug ABC transporter ATP-binding protein [Saccharomonospora piscinae]|uniref:Multidrug ABC transporter ATP-binding protein n=1 Tax=Saccharomonospora piscinae TaxID=687388 RepID=A0A1V9A753_SACPI|nr:ABC transporter ATP-binding protein [Saccharomonospora piscinae]OQO92923.1 multidrug ABC transporter ATP-binding protein [Saccharomonospora piscinae]